MLLLFFLYNEYVDCDVREIASYECAYEMLCKRHELPQRRCVRINNQYYYYYYNK